MPTCADCGTTMRQPVALLNMGGRCERLPIGEPYCPADACTERRHAEDAADRAAADERAIADAIARGVITP